MITLITLASVVCIVTSCYQDGTLDSVCPVTKLIDPEVGTLNGSLQHQAQAFFLSFHPSPSRRGREQSSEVPVYRAT